MADLIAILSTSTRIPAREAVVMYTYCHGAIIVMTTDATIAQTEVTIAAP